MTQARPVDLADLRDRAAKPWRVDLLGIEPDRSVVEALEDRPEATTVQLHHLGQESFEAVVERGRGQLRSVDLSPLEELPQLIPTSPTTGIRG